MSFADAQKIEVPPPDDFDDKAIIAHIVLPEYVFVGKLGRKARKAFERQQKLERDVRKAYPYARIAALKINDIERKIASVSGKERDKIVKTEYNNLMKTFKEPLMKLKVSQGKILVRLVHRETRKTSFGNIKNYKGTVNAYFWQSLALLFGNNLKAEYDVEGSDAEIEMIVRKIEAENGLQQ
ncbi:hypothetical protein FACS1894199_00430 [Bacteroidia bacterium]|nr:hypothetical protein FACS1894199_00430 [Bacteroidia bacterium]